MFQRWLPFLACFVIEFLLIGVGSFYPLGMRAVEMPKHIDLSHCTVDGVQRYDYSPEQCAQVVAGQYMNDPQFLAKTFAALTVAAIVLGVGFSWWGSRQDNQMMLFAGVFSTIAVIIWLPRAYIAALALFVGHFIGWMIMRSYLSKIALKNVDAA